MRDLLRRSAQPQPARPGAQGRVAEPPLRQVASAVGNQAFATLARVPADTTDPVAKPGSAEAAADAALASSDIAGVAGLDLASVSEGKRLKLIELANANADDLMAPYAIEALWSSFGDTVDQIGFRHWDLFAQSLIIEPDLGDLDAVKRLQTTFKADVRAEALRRLSEGEKVVAAELERLEPMTQLGLEAQQSETSAMQLAAYQFERAQKASSALRKIRVRGEFMGKRPDVTRTTTEWYVEPAYFDPGHRPESTTYDDPATDPWKGLPTWEEVKSYYDLLIAGMLELADAQPFLNVSAATNTVHDVAVAPESTYILDSVLEPLRTDKTSIAAAKALLDADTVDVLGLEPVVEAVRNSVAPAASGTPWVGEFYRWIASDTIHEHSSDETKHSLKMGIGTMALLVLASIATDGLDLLFLGAGIGVGAVQAQESRDRASDLEAMENAKLKLGDDLVEPGAASAARVTATIDTIVAFLNILPVFALARGGGAVAGAEARAALTAGDEILSTASRVETVAVADEATAGAAAARPTAPMAVPEVAPDVAPPPRAGGGVQQGAPRPLNIKELRSLFAKSLKRPSALTADTAEISVDAATHNQAWVNAGGTGTPPAAFVDPESGRIWVRIDGEDFLTVFHESVHQLSIAEGHRGPFLDRFGTFLEEGITEGVTRENLGPDALMHAYDRNVNFLDTMQSRLGVSRQMLERAYLDGELGPLEAAIRSGLGGDQQLTDTFLTALRNVGESAQNSEALMDALHIMVTKSAPPI